MEISDLMTQLVGSGAERKFLLTESGEGKVEAGSETRPSMDWEERGHLTWQPDGRSGRRFNIFIIRLDPTPFLSVHISSYFSAYKDSDCLRRLRLLSSPERRGPFPCPGWVDVQ